jgi:hypothetical protein
LSRMRTVAGTALEQKRKVRKITTIPEMVRIVVWDYLKLKT